MNRRAIAGRVTTLKPDDAEAIAQLREIAAAAPGIDGSARAKAGRIAVVASIMGTTPAFLGVRGYRVQAGRFLEDADDAEARRVAVLGARIAEALFPDGDAVGRELRLRGVPFQVIGTLAPKGAADGGDEDGLLVMPIATAMRRVFNRSSISAIFVSAVDAAAMDEASDAVRAAGPRPPSAGPRRPRRLRRPEHGQADRPAPADAGPARRASRPAWPRSRCSPAAPASSR